ncbi:hypothetical protein RFI_00839 [Reticulomyxa filosa]|uniref:Uncharacterized protein n=1 Tax=Reticulomyxa filosa TaxID=46433 RepID=X6PDP1_RETFI|nr:hypothetical protein RFI_00839 [Reticulomyxa filosa]|eukprot:ETO36223.1 hypothetical protein RFI_00839 [Reticulomyxa filosa]
MKLQRKQSINHRRFKLYYTAQVCNKTKKRTFENVWKKSMQIRRQFLSNDCRHYNQKQEYVVQKIIITHIFWKFPDILQLMQLAHNFNNEKDGQIEQKENYFFLDDCYKPNKTKQNKERLKFSIITLKQNK